MNSSRYAPSRKTTTQYPIHEYAKFNSLSQKNDRIVFRTMPFTTHLVKNDENLPQVFIMSLFFANKK